MMKNTALNLGICALTFLVGGMAYGQTQQKIKVVPRKAIAIEEYKLKIKEAQVKPVVLPAQVQPRKIEPIRQTHPAKLETK